MNQSGIYAMKFRDLDLDPKQVRRDVVEREREREKSRERKAEKGNEQQLRKQR